MMTINLWNGGNPITIDPKEVAKMCEMDTPNNREFDKAASEVLKMAKVWFSKTSNGGAYEITHWGTIATPSEEAMRKVIYATYPKSLASKILGLLEGASIGFMMCEVKNLTQFKEFWNLYFRSTIKAA
jgi:hypothetical protein